MIFFDLWNQKKFPQSLLGIGFLLLDPRSVDKDPSQSVDEGGEQPPQHVGAVRVLGGREEVAVGGDGSVDSSRCLDADIGGVPLQSGKCSLQLRVDYRVVENDYDQCKQAEHEGADHVDSCKLRV